MNILSSLYKKIAEEDLKKNAEIISYLAKKFPSEDYKDIFRNIDLRFTIISFNGEVLYDSRNPNNLLQLDNHIDRPEIQTSLAKGTGFDIRKSETLKEKYAYYSVFLISQNNEKIFIRLSSSYESKEMQLFYLKYIQILFFIILNIFIKFFYTNYLKRDLEKKISIMKDFLESNEEKKNSQLYDEEWLSQFWIVLKEWQAKNLNNLDRIEKEKKILNSLLESLPFFIALFDNAGNIIIKNNTFSNLIPENSKNYLEAFPTIEIIDIFKNCLVKQENTSQVIYLKDKKLYWNLNLKYLDFDNVFLLVIQDITKSKQEEKNQREFLNDISHEIKTPLTNIKGYLIALEDADKEDREEKKEFFNIVNRNIIKIEAILQDFLKISKLEEHKISAFSVFSPLVLKDEIISSLSYLLEKKKVDFYFNSNIIDLYLPKNEIISIFKNLIENSIIYNESLIPKIDFNIYIEKNNYKFKLIDNGIGIQESEQDKIFERFYRVEKSRNRNLGGTGLGLAIVKDLIEKLHGTISVQSVVSKGSTFIITIPKNIKI